LGIAGKACETAREIGGADRLQEPVDVQGILGVLPARLLAALGYLVQLGYELGGWPSQR